MKEYKFMGYTFRATSTTTTVRVLNRFHSYTEKIVPLYEIDGLKERGKRPFLTSIEQCKDYIRENG